jgi:hypothetical protein
MILKFIIIIILIFGLFYILFKSIENFSNKNYTNTNILPIEINSSLPYDIKLKNENSSYYDYGTDELNEKFIKIFDINQKKLIKIIEGIEWSNWMMITEEIISKYSKKIINEFENKLGSDLLKLKNNSNYKIIKTNSNRFKYSLDNKKIYLLDIDIIIYRNNKPLAQHIKIIAISNSIYVKFLMVKVIGVIKQCDLSNKLESVNDIKNYSEFIPEKKIIYDMNSFIFDTNDKLVNSQLEYELYQKLLKEIK